VITCGSVTAKMRKVSKNSVQKNEPCISTSGPDFENGNFNEMIRKNLI
jgi:hypothetical protein